MTGFEINNNSQEMGAAGNDMTAAGRINASSSARPIIPLPNSMLGANIVGVENVT